LSTVLYIRPAKKKKKGKNKYSGFTNCLYVTGQKLNSYYSFTVNRINIMTNKS